MNRSFIDHSCRQSRVQSRPSDSGNRAPDVHGRQWRTALVASSAIKTSGVTQNASGAPLGYNFAIDANTRKGTPIIASIADGETGFRCASQMQ
jgi:hypothetical protein